MEEPTVFKKVIDNRYFLQEKTDGYGNYSDVNKHLVSMLYMYNVTWYRKGDMKLFTEVLKVQHPNLVDIKEFCLSDNNWYIITDHLAKCLDQVIIISNEFYNSQKVIWKQEITDRLTSSYYEKVDVTTLTPFLKSQAQTEVQGLINHTMYKEGATFMEEVKKQFQELNPLTEDDARFYFQQLIHVMDFCHQNKVEVEYDINTIFVDNKVLKVLPKALSQFSYKRDGNDFTFSSPEELKSTPYTPPIDEEKNNVWKAGILLTIMLTRDGCPMDHANFMTHCRAILNGDISMPTNVSPACLDLLERSLKSEPCARITIEKIKTHEWFLKDLPELEPGKTGIDRSHLLQMFDV